MMRRFLREPFLHFLVLGAALFVLNAVFNPAGNEPPDRIVVDARQTARLAEQFQRTRMRPPTRQELEGLVEEHVKEAILYREALALGLDRDDPVIRRHMRRKMEFLNADLAEREQATDAELRAFMEAHPGMFRSPGRVSFRHVYFDPENTVGPVEGRAEELLARLNADPAGSADTDGDATLLPGELNAATEAGVSRIFGDEFAAALADAPIDRWSGPIVSAYGVHLVRVSAREPGRLPSLDEVRTAVEREWAAERRAEADSRFYDALRARFTVEIEMPTGLSADPATGNRSP